MSVSQYKQIIQGFKSGYRLVYDKKGKSFIALQRSEAAKKDRKDFICELPELEHKINKFIKKNRLELTINQISEIQKALRDRADILLNRLLKFTAKFIDKKEKQEILRQATRLLNMASRVESTYINAIKASPIKPKSRIEFPIYPLYDESDVKTPVQPCKETASSDNSVDERVETKALPIQIEEAQQIPVMKIEKQVSDTAVPLDEVKASPVTIEKEQQTSNPVAVSVNETTTGAPLAPPPLSTLEATSVSIPKKLSRSHEFFIKQRAFVTGEPTQPALPEGITDLGVTEQLHQLSEEGKKDFQKQINKYNQELEKSIKAVEVQVKRFSQKNTDVARYQKEIGEKEEEIKKCEARLTEMEEAQKVGRIFYVNQVAYDKETGLPKCDKETGQPLPALKVPYYSDAQIAQIASDIRKEDSASVQSLKSYMAKQTGVSGKEQEMEKQELPIEENFKLSSLIEAQTKVLNSKKQQLQELNKKLEEDKQAVEDLKNSRNGEVRFPELDAWMRDRKQLMSKYKTIIGTLSSSAAKKLATEKKRPAAMDRVAYLGDMERTLQALEKDKLKGVFVKSLETVLDAAEYMTDSELAATLAPKVAAPEETSSVVESSGGPPPPPPAPPPAPPMQISKNL